jgi:chorismate mutase
LESESDIGKLRAQIDEIDLALIGLIARRKDVAIEIAKIKQQAGSEGDEERLRQVLDNVERQANELGMDGKKVRELWKELVKYMIEEQMAKHPY